MNLVPGEKIARKIKEQLKAQIQRKNLSPKLVIIYAGENEASRIYVEKKLDWAKEIKMEAELIRLPVTSTDELIKIVERLNHDKEVDGYIIQLPLPKEVSTSRVLSAISAHKDVDGLSPLSLGRLYHGQTGQFISATALAVLECFKYIAKFKNDKQYTAEEISQDEDKLLTKFLNGKNVLIINNSVLVGKPLTPICLKFGATVTVAHRSTPRNQLLNFIKNSDIIISATGQSGLITKDMVRERQVLIDVGINKSAQKIGGDIDITGMKDLDIWVTPVPDGVGPVTVAMLLSNTVKAAVNRKKSGS